MTSGPLLSCEFFSGDCADGANPLNQNSWKRKWGSSNPGITYGFDNEHWKCLAKSSNGNLI
jgi:hypothetical protein